MFKTNECFLFVFWNRELTFSINIVPIFSYSVVFAAEVRGESSQGSRRGVFDAEVINNESELNGIGFICE